MKTCSKCKISKDESDFYRSKFNSDGLRHYCKKCILSYNQTDKMRVAYKEWLSRNPRYRNTRDIRENVKKSLARAREELKNSYLRQLLIQSGFTHEQINKHPLLIEIKRIEMKTKREIKNQTK